MVIDKFKSSIYERKPNADGKNKLKKIENSFKFFRLAFVCFYLLYTPLVANSQEPPNIIWLVIEDTSPQFIGAYGNPDANTPNIDKLAQEGYVFTNAYATGTVCSASRSAIITGVKTFEMGTGNHRSKYELPEKIKGFPSYLKNSGYYTSNNSKTDYNTSSVQKIISQSWNESSNKAGYWNRKPNQPFFSVFNFMASHQSRTMTNPYSFYEKEVLKKLPDDLRVGEDEFEMPPYFLDSPEMRKQVARIYNGVALADYEIGLLLDSLESTGLKDETIIFFYADHGQGMPRAKTNGIGQGFKIPFIIWIPEKYKMLSPWGREREIKEPIDFTDLAATMLSLAGVEIPDYFSGRAIIGDQRTVPSEYLYLSNDRSDNSFNTERTAVKENLIYTRVFTPFSPQRRWIHYMIHGEISQIMDRDFKKGKLNKLQSEVLLPRETEYLYDLEADPWELNNLIADKKYEKDIEDFRSKLKENILTSKDILFLPEFYLDQISEHELLYDYRTRDEYNVEALFDLADLSGVLSQKNEHILAKKLSSGSFSEKYWSLIGLVQYPKLSTKSIDIIKTQLNSEGILIKSLSSLILYNQLRDQDSFLVLSEVGLSKKDKNCTLVLLELFHLLEPTDELNNLVKEIEGRKGLNFLVKQSSQVLLYKWNGKSFSL
ncbi:MAG: sulfatase [Mongoliibacter sp.]|uniref:sulfatase family protein n=1 Tax=Mongoliibacter sp. TaxID=2022438 RepID=UPI0012F0DED8|nr:sulfatase [Mongoliibacter sp.]TVP52354.1 MAG: sulfatase [Mongoliibacter sp.]